MHYVTSQRLRGYRPRTGWRLSNERSRVTLPRAPGTAAPFALPGTFQHLLVLKTKMIKMALYRVSLPLFEH